MRYAILVLGLCLAIAGSGGGTIRGKVTKADGSAIPYANVILVGTTFGGMTLADGSFAIANVPPGMYTVRAMMMGFKAVEKDSVTVTEASTTNLDFQLVVTVVGKTQEIVVTAERALVEVTESKTSAAVSRQPPQSMPVDDVLEKVGLKAGIVKSGDEMHVRGGRGGETRVQIDGSPVSGTLGGGQAEQVQACSAMPSPPVTDPLGSARYRPPVDREQYEQAPENEFLDVIGNPLSTFSIDVDRASYANARRYIRTGVRPPSSAVRVEEFINYFDYDLPEPQGKDPFSITTEVAGCSWTPSHRLVRVALHGRDIDNSALPPSNLVFLIDVSGSMQPENKLPLLRAAFPLLVRQLRKEDRVAIVVYAGASGLALESTPGDQKEKILSVLEQLQAGGSTAGGEGIVLAYKTAREHFMKKGNNRVILATDGDFNVGVTSDAELVKLIEEERESGIFLTVLGVGDGNLQDAKMEKLADHGNGNYLYLDDVFEAQKVFVREMGGTLVTIAKDVKVQVEFNPVRVHSYRLIGYENRMLKKEDFEDDKKDAGELGAGHTVTALYEVDPVVDADWTPVQSLRYVETRVRDDAAAKREVLSVRLRYKAPDGKKSMLIERAAVDNGESFDAATTDMRFAGAVAEFGLILRDSSFRGNASLDHVAATATAAKGVDANGYRAEFAQLAEACKTLVPQVSKER
ncbi:MAG TPA: von Willebrand factor type A domain-containing protein [Candidatus Krumholzibacteria bacterium]|nr:von Willebrand factor type A domain-containing protein [Candidatus Krumholzibacteria bacterium]